MSSFNNNVSQSVNQSFESSVISMASEKKSQFPLSPFESSQKKDPNYLDNSRVDEST